MTDLVDRLQAASRDDRLADGMLYREAVERIVELEADKADMEHTFDLRWEADQRAIKMWQAAHPGNDRRWPDHADLVVWQAERITELEAALEAEHDAAGNKRLKSIIDTVLDERATESDP